MENGQFPEHTANESQRALQIYGDLRAIQHDVVKTTLMGPRSGAVFAPQPDGSTRAYRATFMKPPVSFEIRLFEEKGFTSEEMKGGFVLLTRSKLREPKSYLTYYPGNLRREEEDRLYMNASGKVQRDTRDASYKASVLHEEEKDVLQRVATLIQIPHDIKELFGSYKRFKSFLGERDTNGIDHRLDNPWDLYHHHRLNGLQGYVDNLE